MGLLTEKDDGEKSLSDLTSYYCMIKNIDYFETLLLGDYNIEFGEGLALWSSYGGMKSSYINSVGKSGRNIIAKRGNEENKFFRGIAFSSNIWKLRVSGYYSRNKFDAVVNNSSGLITSFAETGYHRTSAEIKNADSGEEIFIGGRADFAIDSLLNLGLLVYNSKFIPALKLDNAGPAVGQFRMSSLSYKLFFGYYTLSGEIARYGGGFSFISSVSGFIGNAAGFIFSLRSYQNGSSSPHSFPLAENYGRADNEFGFYSAFSYKASFGRFIIYHDRYSPKEFSDLKTMLYNGNETSLGFESKISREIDCGIRLRIETKENHSGNIQNAEERSIFGFVTDLSYNLSREIKLKSWLSYSNYAETNTHENGFAVYQDIRYSGKRFFISARATVFQSSSYLCRIYEYENDIPGLANRASLSGQGVKFYFITAYKFRPILTISLKYWMMFNNKSVSGTVDTGDISLNENKKLSLQFEILL